MYSLLCAILCGMDMVLAVLFFQIGMSFAGSGFLVLAIAMGLCALHGPAF